jgi:hypothetical protein
VTDDNEKRDDAKKAYWLNAEHAKNAIQKYNYYFIGLNFSILALAINHGFETKLILPQISGFAGMAPFVSFRVFWAFFDSK